ncbi:hypothetical protein ACF06O_30830 [Streptomyces albidoflavus]
MSRRQQLQAAARTVLDADGNGRLELGPTTGPPYWTITRVVVATDRPGLAPVPSMALYLDAEDARGLLDVTYDGSRDASDVDLEMQRGQRLIGVWTGGQPGDTATLSVTGWQEAGA